MAFSLKSGNNSKSPVDHGIPAGGPHTQVFNEKAFRRTLLVELKRTEVSKQPFILMLVSHAEDSDGFNGHGLRKKVVASLVSSIRDTDVLGWYKVGRVLGILFTEIDNSAKESVDAIMERVNGGLAFCLNAEEMKKLRIAVYQLSKEQLSEEGLSEFGTYSDSGQRQSLFTAA